MLEGLPVLMAKPDLWVRRVLTAKPMAAMPETAVRAPMVEMVKMVWLQRPQPQRKAVVMVE